MDNYRQSNSSNAFLILSFISFAIYNYCIFNKFALAGSASKNMWWIIIPGAMAFIMSAIYAYLKKDVSSVVLFFVMSLLSVALYQSAKHIKTNNNKENIQQ